MENLVLDRPEIEYLDGRPYPKVSPKRTHGLVQFAVATVIKRCAANRGQIVPEWRCLLQRGSRKTELVPDVAFASFERLRPLTPRNREEPPFAPDVIAEVRSPSHRAGLLTRKIRKYLQGGALLVFDVDPYRRTVRAHSAAGVQDYTAADRFCHTAVPWLEFEVAELFADIDI